jgi:carboxypeptidase C (cathepsin A)
MNTKKIGTIVYALIFGLMTINSFGQALKIPVDTIITTTGQTTIMGKTVAYTAITGTQPIWNDSGIPIATIHYTYYRSNHSKTEERPIVFSFNGGPGSASAWMHLAYTGPKLLNLDDEGYPVQPYGIKDNPFSILDVADLVYINPVNTGYSRTIPMAGKEVRKSDFFGINADINYLAEWMNTFVSRNNRWLSPKYLIGESYGGTRVAGLALALQNRQWMYLNGVILVSPADYQVLDDKGPLGQAINFPYYTATAWYHKKLNPDLQSKSLGDLLPEVENFTLNELVPALNKGGFVTVSEREKLAEKMANYCGLTKEEILQHNLAVPTRYFWKALLRSESGYTIGRLDSRYLGIDRMDAGNAPDYSAELTSWSHSFTPAINYYMREVLNFKTDIKYNLFGNVQPWDKSNNNTLDNLRQAMAQNPFLNVFYQAGYYDGGTTYFNSKYSMWQLDPSGKMKDRLFFEAYPSGHMMYLRKSDLEASTKHLRDFILKTSKPSKPARY